MDRKISTYFFELLLLPRVIDAPGHYLTRGGETVEIVSVSERFHEFGCVGDYPNGIMDVWHQTGRLYSGKLSANDIVAHA